MVLRHAVRPVLFSGMLAFHHPGPLRGVVTVWDVADTGFLQLLGLELPPVATDGAKADVADFVDGMGGVDLVPLIEALGMGGR